jgi:DNA-directed RNA polymerase specialized sigma24 family protein
MELPMTSDRGDSDPLPRRLREGDPGAAAELFQHYRGRPRRMVREVLALRHFEGLSNGETAAVLGLQKAAASNRYVRALKRLKEVLSAIPGFFDP